MISQSQKNGLLGEIAAVRWYRDHGYTIADGNFRTRLGEVDIIAKQGDTLIFCEVKTRAPHSKSLPREAVDFNKQRRLVAAALQYVKLRKWKGSMRFDVAEVTAHKDGNMTVNIIENAFNGNDVKAFGL